jgi:outer membrane protein OmpA-like peptidoglycan-associated protein
MRILLFFLFLVSTNVFFAQNRVFTTAKTAKGKAKDNFDKARDLFRAMQYPEAIKATDAAFKADTNFIDALFLKASIYNEFKNYKAAEDVLSKIFQMSETFDSDIWFYLAQTKRNLEKYNEAIPLYEKFLTVGSKNQVAIKQTQNHLPNCRFIAKAMENPVPFDPKPLSNAVNSLENCEYLPCLTADGETLIFTRRERNDEDFMISKKVNGEWQTAKPMENINTQNNEGAECISADGRFLVFTACNRRDGMGSCDLYFSELAESGWTTPKNMGHPISTPAWESQPSLSADGRTLYFTSSRTGGLGGSDIWRSTRQKDGTWTAPVNLGDKINTAGDDAGPFFHPDSQTLYFMSNGRPSMGGFDLYFARKNEKGEFAEPQNMGYPINTIHDEANIIISLDGKKAMMASDRKYKNVATKSIFRSQGGLPTDVAETETDLYEFDLYEAARPKFVNYVKGKVYDVSNFQNLRAKVEITDLANNEVISTVISDWKGEFLLCLPAGKNYAFTVKRAKYAFYSNNFALDNNLNLEKPFLLDVPLIPLTNGANSSTTTSTSTTEKAKKTVVLKNIFFETASAKLLPISTAELDRLKEMLEENGTLRIQLNGHTDSDGTDASNLTLSSNRAKAVYDYLIQKGIVANRLQYKGFGESQPVATNDTPEGKQENRRTEFEILGF